MTSSFTHPLRPWRRQAAFGHLHSWHRQAARSWGLLIAIVLGVTLGTVSTSGAEPHDTREPSRPSFSSKANRAADDPSVDDLCRAAVTVALAEPERARSFVARARIAGWLPEMHFRTYRRFARTEGLTFADTTGSATPVDVSAVDDFRYEWRASWDLSRMVFNPDELQAHFEGLRMSDVRRDIQTLVIKLYFERRRLLLDNQHAPASETNASLEAEKRLLRVLEIESQLDALSGGLFSDAASHRGQAAATP